MKRKLFILFAVAAGLFTASGASAEKLRVAATIPLLGDLARQVGGDAVEVVDLLKPGGEVHHFEPTASDLGRMRGVRVVFASGKHLESYLDKLRDSLGAGVKTVEVGKTIPSMKIDPENAVFMCCPEHMKGAIDPHWWHSAENMARAARIVRDEMAAADPANAAGYRSRGDAAASRFRSLKTEAERQLSVIPKADRKLVTAHAAFGYFCKEFGFKFVPLLGVSAEEDYSPKWVADAVKVIRDNNVKAVFPENQANPKVIREITRETGVAIGNPLNADGTSAGAGSTFEGMLRQNVAAIVKAYTGR